jgi:hypothetical protein
MTMRQAALGLALAAATAAAGTLAAREFGGRRPAAGAAAHGAARAQPPVADEGDVLPAAARRVPRVAPDEGATADPGNPPYDGRFTFARIRFEPMGGGGFGFGGREDRKWDHDFPRAERNFARILAEVSSIRPSMETSAVLALDDPELFKYPLIYLCEPGYWAPTDDEAAALRAYLTKGGSIIFDDFFGYHWQNFEQQMRKVLPQARLVRLDESHPIFDSFYHIASLDMQSYGRRPAEFWGIFEDNDPAKRLLAIVNYNNDVGENWEWSDAGVIPVDVSNQAYKLGVNYVVYAMTH